MQLCSTLLWVALRSWRHLAQTSATEEPTPAVYPETLRPLPQGKSQDCSHSNRLLRLFVRAAVAHGFRRRWIGASFCAVISTNDWGDWENSVLNLSTEATFCRQIELTSMDGGAWEPSLPTPCHKAKEGLFRNNLIVCRVKGSND